MTFTYNAGSTTPTLAGLVEFNGIRINDGTFKSHHLGGLIDTPPVRGSVTPLIQDHGGYDGLPLYGPRDISLVGWCHTPSPAQYDDVYAAMDRLRSAFVLGDGSLQTLVFKQRGWSTRRQVSARINGSLTFDEPEIEKKKIPSRSFTIPLIAPDPLAYDADNLKSVTISAGSSATLTNAGTVPTPFVARFIGAFSSPVSLTNTTASPDQVIEYDGSAIGGAYIEVSTHPVPQRTVVTNTGVNHYAFQGDWTAFTIPVGTSTWTAAGCDVTVTWRDAWA